MSPRVWLARLRELIAPLPVTESLVLAGAAAAAGGVIAT